MFTRFSVGRCKVCHEGHHLLDGLCWECRSALREVASRYFADPGFRKSLEDHYATQRKET